MSNRKIFARNKRTGERIEAELIDESQPRSPQGLQPMPTPGAFQELGVRILLEAARQKAQTMSPIGKLVTGMGLGLGALTVMRWQQAQQRGNRSNYDRRI